LKSNYIHSLWLYLIVPLLACATAPVEQRISESGIADDFAIDPRDPPMITKAMITGDMLDAIQAVIEYRKAIDEQLTPEEQKWRDFEYIVSYATRRKDDTKPAFALVFMAPLQQDLLGSPHFQGGRGEAHYLVDLAGRNVVCWSFRGELKRTDASQQKCLKFFVMPEPEPLVVKDESKLLEP